MERNGRGLLDVTSVFACRELEKLNNKNQDSW
jgi:hypothetical protein